MKKLMTTYLVGTLLTSMAFAQSSTTSTSTTVAPAAPSKFSGAVQQVIGQDIRKDENNVVTNSQTAISLGYKPADIKYSLSTVGEYGVAGKLKKLNADESKINFSDLSVSAGKNLGKVIGSEDAAGKVSLILPTTAKSRTAKQILGLQGRLDLSHKATNNLSLVAMIKPTLGAKYANRAGSFSNVISAGYSYSITEAVSTGLTLEHVVKYSFGKLASKTSENIGPEVTIGYAPNANLDLTLAVTQTRNAFNPSKADDNGKVARSKYAVMAPEETSASLTGTVLF